MDPINGTFFDVPANGPVTVKPEDGRLPIGRPSELVAREHLRATHAILSCPSSELSQLNIGLGRVFGHLNFVMLRAEGIAKMGITSQNGCYGKPCPDIANFGSR
jgi:hypothetical protein